MTDDDAILAMWRMVERQVARSGSSEPRFRWDGPLFKPEHAYLTAEGYPLGTTCWYVALEHAGYRYVVCAETPQDAVRRAAAIADNPDPPSPAQIRRHA